MSDALRLAATALAACAFEVAPVAAQELRGAPFGESVEVQLVTVQAVVSDRSGRPVLDLTRGDFRLYEDGEPVAITHFQPPAGPGTAPVPGSASAEAGASAGAVPHAKLSIVVDDLRTGPGGRRRLFDQLQTALRRGLGPADEVLVARYAGGAVEVVVPFTRDRREVFRALEEMEGISAHQLVASLETERTLDRLRLRAQSDAELGGAGRADACVGVGEEAQGAAEEALSGVLGTIAALSGFVDSLSGLPGRKALLHVSDGLPLIAGYEAWTYAIEMCDGTGVRAGLPNAFDVTSMGSSGRYTRFDPVQGRLDRDKNDTTSHWQVFTARANAQGVIVHTVQASGLSTHRNAAVDGARMTFEADVAGRRNLQDTLVLLASETGGRALLDANDLGPGLDAVLDEARSAYQLAFAPLHAADGRAHGLRLEVAREGLTVRHRRSYFARTREDLMVEGVWTALFHGSPANPMAVRAELMRLPGEDGTPRQRVRVRIPLVGLTLLPEPGGVHGLFTIYLVARDEAGATTPIRSRTIPVRIRDGADEGVEDAEYVYDVDLSLERPVRDLAVGVRDEIGEARSYIRRSEGG